MHSRVSLSVLLLIYKKHNIKRKYNEIIENCENDPFKAINCKQRDYFGKIHAYEWRTRE